MRGCRPGWLSGITPCTYIVGGDTWILTTDGVSEPLTDIDYNINDDLIMRIVKNNPVNPAEVLVKVSGETYYPCYTTDLCKDSRTAVVIRIEEA